MKNRVLFLEISIIIISIKLNIEVKFDYEKGSEVIYSCIN